MVSADAQATPKPWLRQPWHCLGKLRKTLFSMEMISITNAMSWWRHDRKCKYTYYEENQVQQVLTTIMKHCVYARPTMHRAIDCYVIARKTKWYRVLVRNRWLKIVFWSPFMCSLCREENEMCVVSWRIVYASLLTLVFISLVAP